MIRRSHSERGGALVITVLITLAMTGLALVAVGTVQVETKVAHNQKMLKQASYIAETGLMMFTQNITSAQRFLDSCNIAQANNNQARCTIPLSMVGGTAGIPAISEQYAIDLRVDSVQTGVAGQAGYQLNNANNLPGLIVSISAQGKLGQQLQNPNNTVNYSERRAYALVPLPGY